MSSSMSSITLNILQSLYQHTESLEAFAQSIAVREGEKIVLVQPSDTNRFKTFVKGVFICFDKKPQDGWSCNETCTFPELLAVVLNTIIRKNKKNVLAHGYNLLPFTQEQRNADLFKLQGEITQSAAYIRGSCLWKQVASRLGTDITRYLLEGCAVFVAVPPSCLFQVCGVPIYDRVQVASASTGFYLQPRSNGKKRARPDKSVWNRKRKRETDQTDETDMETLPGKKRRVGQEGPTNEIQQDCFETLEKEQPLSAKSAPSLKPLENSAAGLEQPGGMQTRTNPSKGEPTWRSGTYPPLPPSQCFIYSHGLLYGGKGMGGLLLNRKRNSADGRSKLNGQHLLRIIFFEGLPYLKGVEKKPKKLPRRYFNMVPLFDQLMHQHKKCPYRIILQRFCPLMKVRNTGEEELHPLLAQHCAPHRVYLFVKKCLSTVIPQELWGSEHNRLNFFARVRGFLQNGKYERLSVAELMWKMKVNDCDWLKISKTGKIPPCELSYRTQILGQFLAWLLDGYVVSLVRACFYATESVGQKNLIRFYRCEVWEKLQDLGLKDHLSKGQMEELTAAQVAALPKSTIITSLRFIPKTNGMRPITRLKGADVNLGRNKGCAQDLLHVLKACVRSRPSLLGSTVWGEADIHKKLVSIAPAQKEKLQDLYFVKVDVKGAFESLPHHKLIEVVGKAFSPFQDKSVINRHYAKVWSNSYEGLKKSFIKQADIMEGDIRPSNMKGFVMSMQESGKLQHSILVEQRFSLDLRVGEKTPLLTQMLTGSVVKFGEKTYRQCRGIPQGSAVSHMLCCLIYGHLENTLFKGIPKEEGCLMRQVDDFLLITPDIKEALNFLRVMLAGVPQYGLVVNPQKVAVNFHLPECGGPFADINVLPLRCLFPWCGLLIDTHTLDVYRDYSSYAGTSLRYSLTLGSSRSPGQQMKRKLMAVLRLKFSVLLLDLKMNSVEAVYKNLYKLVLLHAHRFHVCARSLPFGMTVAKNPMYFLQMIWDMAEYANHIIRRDNKELDLGNKAQTGVLQFEAVELLFCLSFLVVLSKHRALYKGLLPHLRKRKRSLEHRLGDLRLARVRQASTPRIPADFMAIQV
ncbi:telomerase reverse transcriptase [Xyrichtys novacula]|uniref:Telomerase reverse transcriptase n=1 Tax=Xyrichtys novacula TaxID=13765 RepID=A0AAV1HE75_XYRNO|nr:telomerase reverse transcriptase [Xyrichtys novacula]